MDIDDELAALEAEKQAILARKAAKQAPNPINNKPNAQKDSFKQPLDWKKLEKLVPNYDTLPEEKLEEVIKQKFESQDYAEIYDEDNKERKKLKEEWRQYRNSKERRRPWQTQQELLGQKPWTAEQFVDKIVGVSRLDMNVAAYFSALFLTGSRACELIPYVGRPKHTRKGTLYSNAGLEYPGLKLKNIYFDMEDLDAKKEPKFLVIKSRVAKDKNSKSLHWKESYISLDPASVYEPIVKILWNYLQSISPAVRDADGPNTYLKTDGERIVFPFSRKTINRWAKKYLKCSLHYIRHLRAIILANEHQFTTTNLMDYFQWKGHAMAVRYAKSQEKYIIKNKILDV